jgi:hypothetical protein
MDKVELTDKERQLIEEGGEVTTFEGLYYLFYFNAVKRYRLSPTWTTYHDLAKALLNPYHTEWSQTAVAQQNKKFFRPDIETAGHLALIDLHHNVRGGLPPVKLHPSAAEAKKVPLLNEDNPKYPSVPIETILEASNDGCVFNGPLDGPPTEKIRKRHRR